MAAATEPPLALDAAGVKHAIGAAANAPLPEYEAFDDDFDETLDLFAEVAEACETNGRSSDAVLANAKKLVAMHREHASHRKALAHLRENYACSLDATDFAAVLDATAKSLLESDAPYREKIADLERKIAAARRKAKAGGAANRDGGDGSDGSDEDVDVVVTQAGRPGDFDCPNLKCPLTQLLIKDIATPVVDQKGYVYEKDAVMDYIARYKNPRTGRAECPQAGTNHEIRSEDLKPARAIERARKRAKALADGGGGGGGGGRKRGSMGGGRSDAEDLISP